MKENQLAIAILSYNHPELTAKCVDKVLNLRTSHPVLLIHNGSEPRWVDRLRVQHPEIEHLILPENLGFTGGANLGLAQLFKQYPWVLFLTNDTQLQSLPAPPQQAGLYAPKIYGRKPGIIDSLGGAVNLTSAVLRHLKTSEINLSRKEFFYVPGTAFVIHRDIFTATQGFDLSLNTYWEDVDLSLKVKSMGLMIDTYPELTLSHAIGKTCHKNPVYTTYLFQRNRRKVCLRYAAGLKQKISILIRVTWSLIKIAFSRARQGRFEISRLALRAMID